MVQVASLFNQLLQHLPRTEFAALVKKHAAERDAKGFTCWTQFVSILFCQLGRADSLREICNGLACCLGRLVHVGISKAPCRSTLSYANHHRPAALFEELCFTGFELTTGETYRSLHICASGETKEKEEGLPHAQTAFHRAAAILGVDATIDFGGGRNISPTYPPHGLSFHATNLPNFETLELGQALGEILQGGAGRIPSPTVI
jgi:hypothetical protein